MPVDTQEETIAFLTAVLAERQDTALVEVMQTHISVILLAGQRALKLKRDVRLPYVDFSTPAHRLAACERELALNKRTAPLLYRGVHRVTRGADGGLAVDGDGPLVDAVVEMVRFDQDRLLENLAITGDLTLAHVEALARQVACFHGALAPDRQRAGSPITARSSRPVTRAGALRTEPDPSRETPGCATLTSSAGRLAHASARPKEGSKLHADQGSVLDAD